MDLVGASSRSKGRQPLQGAGRLSQCMLMQSVPPLLHHSNSPPACCLRSRLLGAAMVEASGLRVDFLANAAPKRDLGGWGPQSVPGTLWAMARCHRHYKGTSLERRLGRKGGSLLKVRGACHIACSCSPCHLCFSTQTTRPRVAFVVGCPEPRWWRRPGFGSTFGQRGSEEGLGRLGTSKRPWTAMGDGALT